MVSLKEFVALLLSELKLILKEYALDAEAAVKQRIRRILIYGIIIGVLTALVTSFLGSASIFILIGSLRYLEMSMPAWAAWYIIGITSGIIGAILILVIYLIIRKQLKSDKVPNQN